jgi:hypothetical protein
MSNLSIEIFIRLKGPQLEVHKRLLSCLKNVLDTIETHIKDHARVDAAKAVHRTDFFLTLLIRVGNTTLSNWGRKPEALGAGRIQFSFSYSSSFSSSISASSSSFFFHFCIFIIIFDLHLHSSSTSAFFFHICFFFLLPRCASSLRKNQAALARVRTPALVIVGLCSLHSPLERLNHLLFTLAI